jgi:hypothetical protein
LHQPVSAHIVRRPADESNVAHRLHIAAQRDLLSSDGETSMMPTDHDQDRLVRDATTGLREAKQFLARPSSESLNQCYPCLEQAVGNLRLLESSLRDGSPKNALTLRKELQNLQREVRAFTAMLQSAASFYQGWSRLLAAACTMYTPAGVPTPPPRQRRTAWEA